MKEMMGLHENLSFNFIDFLWSQKSSIELLYLLSSRTLLSYKPLSYKENVYCELSWFFLVPIRTIYEAMKCLAWKYIRCPLNEEILGYISERLLTICALDILQR